MKPFISILLLISICILSSYGIYRFIDSTTQLSPPKVEVLGWYNERYRYTPTDKLYEDEWSSTLSEQSWRTLMDTTYTGWAVTKLNLWDTKVQIRFYDTNRLEDLRSVIALTDSIQGVEVYIHTSNKNTQVTGWAIGSTKNWRTKSDLKGRALEYIARTGRLERDMIIW
jgi:hypothetical protein